MATPSVSPIDCCPTSTETSSTSSASRSSGRTRSTCRRPAAPPAAPSVLRPRPSSRNLLPFSFFREERFAFGHHYFRPHETHHSPSRRFYHNELFRVPLYEIIPLEAVVGTCCVLDLYTYCKGKWLGSSRSALSCHRAAAAHAFLLARLVKRCPRPAVTLRRTVPVLSDTFFLLF